MAMVLALLVALAAALLGVAAARRGWWTKACIAGACSFLALFAAIYLTGPAADVQLPMWVSAAAALLVLPTSGWLAVTAWMCERDRKEGRP
ncbi:hypothetical protein ACFXJ8_12045 [Nonomuraea sp. NPDC059194]|uniref:hypothetical protein n=1 Tax=Nonomuraea sp. NPDC059194 TaxID=3346764 RepID=UPI0036A74DC1